MVDLYGRAKIQPFITEWSTSQAVTLNNWYRPLTVIPPDSHKLLQLKLVFGEHILQINTEINMK